MVPVVASSAGGHCISKGPIRSLGKCSAQPSHVRVPGIEASAVLAGIMQEFMRLLKDIEIPVVARCLKGQSNPVSSPYAGGVLVEHAEKLSSSALRPSPSLSTASFRIASLNPGRTGLAALNTDDTLYWRLWSISLTLSDQGCHMCVLPGARMPPGARLPILMVGPSHVRMGGGGGVTCNGT